MESPESSSSPSAAPTHSRESESPSYVATVPAFPPHASALSTRAWAAFVFLLAGALVSIAVYLKPDNRGFGTHQQLGFGACGWLVTTGLPCPSCGMTTAFANTVRGRLLQAAYAQPAGFLLAVCALLAIPISLWTLVTGRLRRTRFPWLTPMQIFALGMGVFLGGWAFKIAVGLLDGSLPVTSWH